MTTKPKARKFRIRRSTPLGTGTAATARPAEEAVTPEAAAPAPQAEPGQPGHQHRQGEHGAYVGAEQPHQDQCGGGDEEGGAVQDVAAVGAEHAGASHHPAHADHGPDDEEAREDAAHRGGRGEEEVTAPIL